MVVVKVSAAKKTSTFFKIKVTHRGHMAWRPPSTMRLMPVEKEASSEAKKAMALATSSGWPGRPRA
jgi:hypothetical protein